MAQAAGANAGASEPPVISVLMPVYNGAGVLPQSLPPLMRMAARGEIAEVIVIDDGSDDGSATIAASHGARVMESGGRLGPGGARNRAAPEAIGDILWFVDADVVAHDDAAQVLLGAFADPDVAAVFGSYDDHPPAQNFLSQYKNLVHHHYHAREGGPAETFWAGCGAIRKEAFAAAGGFDAQRYPQPSIEDIELGMRLRRRGLAIRLVPALQGTHLKVWRPVNWLRTEIFCRALPWSRLMQQHGMTATLNTTFAERARALLAIVSLIALIAALAGLVPRWIEAAAIAAVFAANAGLFALFLHTRGLAFAIGGVAVHQVYYIYSAATFAFCWVERMASALRPSRSTIRP